MWQFTFHPDRLCKPHCMVPQWFPWFPPPTKGMCLHQGMCAKVQVRRVEFESSVEKLIDIVNHLFFGYIEVVGIQVG